MLHDVRCIIKSNKKPVKAGSLKDDLDVEAKPENKEGMLT
jgi:hypothetical protein